jgi:hypothetical protein
LLIFLSLQVVAGAGVLEELHLVAVLVATERALHHLLELQALKHPVVDQQLNLR